MNTETETNTQQNATKPVKGKKEKKEKKDKTQTEQNETEKNVVKETIIESVPEPVPEPITEQETVQESAQESAQESEQELEVSSQEGENTELYFIKLQTVVDVLTELSNSSIEDITYDKEHASKLSESSIKINKLVTQFLTNVLKKQCKTNIISLKNNKELKKVKKVKTTEEKANCAVNKEVETFPFVLDFLGLPADKLISKGDLLKGICNFVKKEKDAGNPDILDGTDKQYFKLIGSLKVLFDNFKVQMIQRGKIKEGDAFPDKIKYTGIMGFLPYGFHPKK